MRFSAGAGVWAYRILKVGSVRGRRRRKDNAGVITGRASQILLGELFWERQEKRCRRARAFLAQFPTFFPSPSFSYVIIFVYPRASGCVSNDSGTSNSTFTFIGTTFGLLILPAPEISML